ncbi:hypothetical protein ACFQ9X_41020 [Catenulispora yoronensis]
MHRPGFWLLSTATRWMLSSPAKGGEPLTELATAPAVRNGEYYNRSRPVAPSPHAHDREAAERLWQATEALRGPFPAKTARPRRDSSPPAGNPLPADNPLPTGPPV